MNGNETYENKYKTAISNLIINNPDKPYLKGFSNFINKSQCTIYNYLIYVIAFINYVNKNVEDLELDDYTNYLSSLNDKSVSCKILAYSSLKLFSLYLKASERNEKNSMQYVNRPKFYETEETKNKREIGYLNQKEIHKYLKNIERGVGSKKAKSRQKEWINRDKLIIVLLLSTGMRCSALYKLDVDNVDVKNKTISVLDKGNKYKKYELSPDIVSIMIDWLNDRKKLLNNKEELALFISNERTRISQASIARIVNKYAVNIEGKNITPHKLRATYGTQLYEKTGDLYMVQECMGHSSPKTTELYIRGKKNKNAQMAAEIMSKILF